jgi:hypothetical protein
MAPLRSSSPPPSSPVVKHIAPSSPLLPSIGHRRRRSCPPPLFSSVSAAPTLLCFLPPTAIAWPDAFPPPWAGPRTLPQCGQACSSKLRAAHPLEPIGAVVFQHLRDRCRRQPSPVRSPNPRPLKWVPHLILSLVVLSVQHLVAGHGEASGPPQPWSKRAPWSRPTSRVGYASPQVHRPWAEASPAGLQARAESQLGVLWKFLSYFLNKFKTLQT